MHEKTATSCIHTLLDPVSKMLKANRTVYGKSMNLQAMHTKAIRVSLKIHSLANENSVTTHANDLKL